jgi:hypothetical protein
MANVNRPSGFTPVGYLNGASWNGQARLYSIAAAYATALYIGDPVISAGSASASGLPTIALGATTGALRGVLVGLGTQEGLLANPSNLDITYRPAATTTNDWFALVVDDPNVIFEIQEQSSGTALAATDIGMNTISVSGTGNGFVSGWQLASASGASPATTATLQLRLLGLARKLNNAFGAYAKHLVQINVHELAHGTGAAGV